MLVGLVLSLPNVSVFNLSLMNVGEQKFSVWFNFQRGLCLCTELRHRLDFVRYSEITADLPLFMRILGALSNSLNGVSHFIIFDVHVLI